MYKQGIRGAVIREWMALPRDLITSWRESVKMTPTRGAARPSQLQLSTNLTRGELVCDRGWLQP